MCSINPAVVDALIFFVGACMSVGLTGIGVAWAVKRLGLS